MSDVDSGGPAFPGESYLLYRGMSLRDWFAGQALPKCLISFAGEAGWLESAARSAYEIADSMLLERNKEVENHD